MNAANYATLASHAKNDNSYLNGPSAGGAGGENVMCLSCHRAHASGWQYDLRWNAENSEVPDRRRSIPRYGCSRRRLAGRPVQPGLYAGTDAGHVL